MCLVWLYMKFRWLVFMFIASLDSCPLSLLHLLPPPPLWLPRAALLAVKKNQHFFAAFCRKTLIFRNFFDKKKIILSAPYAPLLRYWTRCPPMTCTIA